MNLGIQIDSFRFSKDLVHPNDRIRVIVTTLPDDQSQAININSKKISSAHLVFTAEISKLTKKLIIVFRRKSKFKKDCIIGSTIIRSDQFPNKINDKYNTEMKNIPIYEPFPTDFNNNFPSNDNRRIIGKIEIQFALSDIPQVINSNNEANI